MKLFLIRIAVFFAIVSFVDYSLGKLFYYVQSRAGGRTGTEFYVSNKATEDIIIMGSSRASHHYVPSIISEKLGMTCFNAGQDGNGIILQYGRWKMLSERYAPKLLIYDVCSDFDIAVNDNMTYIDRLKPFCSDASVKEYVAKIFPLERLKTHSKMYCYNYKFIEMTFDFIRNSDFKEKSGYIPLYGLIRNDVVEKPLPKKESYVVTDIVKFFYLEQLLKEAKENGTNVVFVVSPSWKGGLLESVAYSEVKDLANKYNICFIDYTNSVINDNPEYFEDSSHLNYAGARVFTEDFASLLSKETIIYQFH